MIYINLVIFIFIFFYSVKKYKLLFNPLLLGIYNILIILIIIPIIQIIIYNYKDSVITDIIILSYIFSILIGTEIKINWKRPNYSFNLNNFKLNLLLIIFLILAAILYTSLIVNIISGGGFSLFKLRMFYNKIIETNLSSIYAITYSLYIIVEIYLLDRKSKLFYYLLPFSILFGKKQVIFSLILLILMTLEYRKRIKKSQILFWLFISIIFGAIIHVLTYNFQNGIKSVIQYFDYYHNLSYLVESLQTGKLNFFYGKLTFTSFYKIIPRIIWETKPHVYGFLFIHQKLFPYYFSIGVFPSFFEEIAVPYADFGILGVFFFGFIKGFILRQIFFFAKNYNFPVIFILFIVYKFSIPMFFFIYILFLVTKNRVDYQYNKNYNL